MAKELKDKSSAELKKLVCENKIVRVVPIGRKKAYLKRGKDGQPHDGEDIYTGCTKDYGLPWIIKKRSYANPFKNDDEQAIFEMLLDQKEGALNLYKFESEFWGKFTIKLSKEGVPLNLMNPSDALMYRVLLADPKGASKESEKHIVEKQYMIINEAEEKEQASLIGAKQDKANDFMYKLKKSKKDMINVLRLLDKKPDEDSDAEWLKSELYKIINEVTVPKGMAGLDKFLSVMEDPRQEIKLLVLDAIDAGEIIREQAGYKLEHKGKYIGRKYEDVVEYFSSQAPEVLEEKLVVQEIIKH